MVVVVTMTLISFNSVDFSLFLKICAFIGMNTLGNVVTAGKSDFYKAGEYLNGLAM